MIPPGEIARFAHRASIGDKTIESDYVLTWTLLALANSPLRDRLAFKGGTALKKIYAPDYRFSEDLCALLGRTEPRDLYDIHYIFEENLADTETVSYRLNEKMAHKGLDRAGLQDVLTRKHKTLERLWEPRLRGQMPELPHLETVIRETERQLRQWRLT